MAVATTRAGVAQQAETLQTALCHAKSLQYQELPALAACLIPMLEALRWRGEPRHVAEALPHFAAELDLVDFRNILSNLGYRTQPLRKNLRQLDKRLLPCLYITDSGEAWVAISCRDDVLTVFDGAQQVIRNIATEIETGTAYVVEQIVHDEEGSDKSQSEWFRELAERFRPLVARMLGVTLVTNLLALAVPLFVMAVYDRVIAGNSPETLLYLAAGIVCSAAGWRRYRSPWWRFS